MTDRHLDWPACHNYRDLGGLPVAGGQTRRGALVRGDSPERLTAAGWTALWEYGIRTVIDLRGAGEGKPDAAPRPAGLRTVRLPLDDYSVTGFWEPLRGLDCTPLYYRAFLERFPERAVRVLAAIAGAPAGGVLVHCAGGRDRTGLIVLLLLALAGVPAEHIAEDYLLSAERLAPLWVELGVGDQNGKVEDLVLRHGTTLRDGVLTALRGLDVETYLRRNGLTDVQLAAIRARFAA